MARRQLVSLMMLRPLAGLALAGIVGAAAAAPPQSASVTGVTRVQAAEFVIFQNGNAAAVESGPQRPTHFSISMPYVVTYIDTYHYFNGGVPAGQIGLRSDDTGQVYGPWQAFGQVGQGGVPDATWVVRPGIAIPPGRYTVLDSHRPTWSTNGGSGYAGFATVKGFQAN